MPAPCVALEMLAYRGTLVPDGGLNSGCSALGGVQETVISSVPKAASWLPSVLIKPAGEMVMSVPERV